MPALRMDAALVHLNRADRLGNGQYLGPDPYFDDLFCEAADAAYVSCERLVETAELTKAGRPADPARQAALGHRRRRDPERRALHLLRPRLRPRRGLPEAVRDHALGRVRRALPAPAASEQTTSRPSGPGTRSRSDDPETTAPGTRTVTRAEYCVIACAEAWRDNGEVLASPMGLIPSVGARLAKRTFSPDLLLTDGEAMLVGLDGTPEGWLPYRQHLTMVTGGRRHVMMGASQIDRFGNQNISCIGDWEQPARQLLGVRGAPVNTLNNPISYWIPKHSPRVFVERVDMVSGVGYDRAAAAGPSATRYHRIPRVVTDLGVFDFATADRSMRLASAAPGVTVDQVRDGDRLRAGDRGRGAVHPRADPRGAAADPRGHRPGGRCATARSGPDAIAMRHAAHRAGRRPAPDRADRHGLGRRAPAGLRHRRTPGRWASWPPRR